MSYQQPNMPQGPVQPPPGKGQSIASMVLGIVSLVVPYGGLAIAIVGLILGIISKKKLQSVGAPFGMATAGIVTSIIALAWSVILIFLCAGLFAASLSY